MAPHILAQDAAWFTIMLFVVGAYAIWRSYSEDKED